MKKINFLTKLKEEGKLSLVEESDETLFWLEMLVETGKATPEEVEELSKEMEELLRIFSASRRTAAQANVTNQ